MKDTIFLPKYSFKKFLDVIIIILLLIFSLVFSYLKIGFRSAHIFGWIYLVFFLGWISHFLIRRIVFSRSTFYVEKFVWPAKTFEYTDVIDLGKTKIKTRRGEISFAGMGNAPELLSRFTELIEQGKINKRQIENKVVIQEIIFRKSIIPSIVVSSILWGVTLYFWPYYHYRFGILGICFSLFVIFVLVMFIFQWIIKKAGYR
jgi:hypothetical protein